MVNVTDGAVRKAMQATTETQQSLVRNLNNMSAGVQRYLAQWNDTNVLQFLNLYREQCNAVAQLSGNLEQIYNFCNNTLRWMNAYLDG